MKKVILALVAVALIGFVLVKNSQESNTETIKVGVITPLTGNFAIFGERMRNAMEMAKEDLGAPAANIQLIYEDACQPAQAVSAAQKLIQADKVSWIAGSFCLVGLVP